jgi:hypothetical protein
LREKIDFDILRPEISIFLTVQNGNNDKYTGMTEMNINLSHTFVMGILLSIAFSPAALADVPVEFAIAQQALDEQDLQEAAIHLRKAAEQNYLPAQTAMGDLMRISQDYEDAFGWYLTAAYQGDAPAEYALGRAYASGEGVEKNSAKAVYWITHAAEKNNVAAATALAMAYRSGDLGLPKDIDQAKKWEDRLPALIAVEQKELKERLADLRVAQREARIAAIKAAAAKKEAAKKAENEAATKKVDSADVANAKNASENTKQ